MTRLPTIFEPTRAPDDGWELAEPRKVSAGTQRVIDSLVDAFIPAEPREDDTVDKIGRHLRTMVQYMPRMTGIGFIATLHLINWASIWRFRGVATMVRLSRAQRIEELNSLAQSRYLPIRLLLLGPQGLILSTYFDQDQTHQLLDYEPKSFTKSRIELRRKLLQGEAPTADDEIHHMPPAAQ